MELSPSPIQVTPNHVRSIDKSKAADWIEGALASPPLHLDSLAAASSHLRRRRESAPPLPPGIPSRQGNFLQIPALHGPTALLDACVLYAFTPPFRSSDLHIW